MTNRSEKITCSIVAIAKNEAKYLPEWFAYHLSIGVDQILLYDNDSEDDTLRICARLAEHYPIRSVVWPSRAGASAQRSAYADALPRLDNCEWAAFIDIDEFIVPWGYDDLQAFIRAIPDAASAVLLNWKTFGSSGVTGANYGTVLQAFKRCAPPSWGNNKHFKTIARVGQITETHIHDFQIRDGEKLTTDFQAAEFASPGRTIAPVYSGIQINHYQTKSWQEFSERMARGNANFPPGHPSHARNGTVERFQTLDRNEEEDVTVARFLPAFETTLRRVYEILSDT